MLGLPSLYQKQAEQNQGKPVDSREQYGGRRGQNCKREEQPRGVLVVEEAEKSSEGEEIAMGS